MTKTSSMNDGGAIQNIIDRQAILDCLTRYDYGAAADDRIKHAFSLAPPPSPHRSL
jgi:hypothetical protein